MTSPKRKILTPKKQGKITMAEARKAVKETNRMTNCKWKDLGNEEGSDKNWKCETCGKYVFYENEQPTECVKDNDKFISLRSGEKNEPSDGEIYQATSIANTPDKVNKEIDDIIKGISNHA